MKIDLYTKAILTVLALALTALTLNPFFAPRAATARDEPHLERISQKLSDINSRLSDIGRDVSSIRADVSRIVSQSRR